MATADEELKRRRERGKRAQSAFRKRQAQSQQGMKDENMRLKQAIAALDAEVRPDDRPELRDKIEQAAADAGLRGGSAVEIDSLKPASSTTPSSSAQSSKFCETASSSSHTQLSATPSATALIQLRQAYYKQKSEDPFYGWSTCLDGAITIIPFLGQGAYTFAGRIFWHIFEKHEQSLRAHSTIYEEQIRMKRWEGDDKVSLLPPLLNGPKKTVMELLSATQSVHQAFDPGAWLDVIDERLNDYKQRAFRYEAAGHSRSTKLLPGCEVEVLPDGTPVQWLTPCTAANRIRSVVGDGVFALLATPAIERYERHRNGHPFGEHNEPVDGFLDVLADTFVCRGNGPFWELDEFDRSLKSWLGGVTGGVIRTY